MYRSKYILDLKRNLKQSSREKDHKKMFGGRKFLVGGEGEE
jgi:hypothetical protein